MGRFYALLTLMDLPLHDLPDDVDALKAMVLAMARDQAKGSPLEG